jgi:zinc and cadmium transporter
MPTFFFQALGAAVVASLVSLVGVGFLGLAEKKQKRWLFGLISFSAGSLLGGAFLHLLPEALEESDSIQQVFQLALGGFILFFVLERVLLWHHCHEEHCEIHHLLGYQNLVGDGLHNFIDGLVLIAAFSVSTELGLVATLAVVLHEVPQEIGDFAVLLYSGFSRTKAVVFNLISASLALLGVLAGFFLLDKIPQLVAILLPLAAGGFIYIAAADLIPELHREKSLKKSLTALGLFLLALVVMAAI